MQLGVLAVNLRGRGFTAQVTRAGKRGCVGVASQSVPQLSETVYAAPADDGTWWFWWSWGDRIAPVGEVDTAAFKIAYVLTPHADG
jgi:uncharacterized protein with LGFP repeats